MGLKQIDHGTKEYGQMVALRLQILRAPLGLSFSNSELEREVEDILIAAFEEEEMLGCCILSWVAPQKMRVRQMAVHANLQRKGIGASLMSFSENIARDKGCRALTMHARETAIGFYEKFGYRIIGDPFVEVGLPHRIMEKPL